MRKEIFFGGMGFSFSGKFFQKSFWNVPPFNKERNIIKFVYYKSGKSPLIVACLSKFIHIQIIQNGKVNFEQFPII